MKYFYFFFIIIFISCQNGGDINKQNHAIQFNTKLEFNLVDSIVFKEFHARALMYCDQRGKKFLAFDYDHKKLIQFDRSGIIDKQLNLSEDSPLFSWGALQFGYVSDNHVAFTAREGIYLIDMNKESKQTVIHEQIVHTSGQAHLDISIQNSDTNYIFNAIPTDDSIFQLVNNDNLMHNADDNRFPSKYQAEQKNISFYTSGQSQIQSVVSFPPNSIHKRKDIYFPSCQTTICSQGNKYYVLFQMESTVYVYDKSKDGLTLSDSIPFLADHANPLIGFPVNKPFNSIDQFRIDENNLFFNHISARGDTLCIGYHLPNSYKKLQSFNSIKEIMDFNLKDWKQYLIVLVNGKKICADVPIPSPSLVILYRAQNGEFIMSRDHKLKELPFDINYMYRLVLKPIIGDSGPF